MVLCPVQFRKLCKCFGLQRTMQCADYDESLIYKALEFIKIKIAQTCVPLSEIQKNFPLATVEVLDSSSCPIIVPTNNATVPSLPNPTNGSAHPMWYLVVLCIFICMVVCAICRSRITAMVQGRFNRVRGRDRPGLRDEEISDEETNNDEDKKIKPISIESVDEQSEVDVNDTPAIEDEVSVVQNKVKIDVVDEQSGVDMEEASAIEEEVTIVRDQLKSISDIHPEDENSDSLTHRLQMLQIWLEDVDENERAFENRLRPQIESGVIEPGFLERLRLQWAAAREQANALQERLRMRLEWMQTKQSLEHSIQNLKNDIDQTKEQALSRENRLNDVLRLFDKLESLKADKDVSLSCQLEYIQAQLNDIYELHRV